MTVCAQLKLHKILFSIRNNVNFIQKRCFALKVDNAVLKHFQDTFGLSHVKVHSLMLQWPTLQNISKTQIDSAVETLQSFGISKENIVERPKLLNFHSFTLKTRLLVMIECGFLNINMNTLGRYVTLITKRTIFDLKRNRFLPEDIQIWEKLVDCFDKLPNVQKNFVKITDINEKTLCEIRLELIRQFLKMQLNISDRMFNQILKTYPLIKHRSLKNTCEALDIIENQLNFPKDRIMSHGYLIGVNPDNIKKLISEVKEISNIDIKEILYKYPLLIKTNYESILKMKQIFKDEGFSDESTKRCLQIFTLSTDTIQQRITELKMNPLFDGYLDNPRVLETVYYGKKVSARLSQLQKINKECSSLHKLVSGEKEFKKYSSNFGDKTKGSDIMNYLSKYKSDHFDKVSLRTSLSRHPFWLHIPLQNIVKNWQYLIQHFSTDDIFSNCHLLLYHLEDIKFFINLIYSTETNYKYNFLNFKMIDPEKNASKTYTYDDLNFAKLTNKQVLNMCLYLLEKDDHYSGNGVWPNHKIKNNSLSISNNDTCSNVPET